jgi:hypothetical protein
LDDLTQRRSLMLERGQLLANIDAVLTRMERVNTDIVWVRNRLEALRETKSEVSPEEPKSELANQLESLEEALTEAIDEIVAPEDQRGIHESNRIMDRLGRIGWYVGSNRGAPRPAEQASLAKIAIEVSEVIARIDQLLNEKLPALSALILDAGLVPFGEQGK